MISLAECMTINEIGKELKRIEQMTGYPALVALSQGILESGWFRFQTGDFNYFGITAQPEKMKAKFCKTQEFVSQNQLALFRADERATAVLANGQRPPKNRDEKVWWSMSRWFRSYNNLTEGLMDYVNLITTNKRYAKAIQAYRESNKTFVAKEKLIRDIALAGYSSGPAAEQEIKISRQNNVRGAVA